MSVDDGFELHDLRVEVVAGERGMVCNHEAGDYFELSGENLSFPAGQTFPLYPLAALLPLLPAKQRDTHPHDWMTTDMEVACPDPHCGARFRITRTGKSAFRHGDVTRVPLGPARSATNPERPPLRLPRSGVIRGCWQLSSGHGRGWSRRRAFEALDAAAAVANPLVLDCADIYTGVERLIGDWLRGRPDLAGRVVVHTKFVPDLDALPAMDRDYVRRVVLRSRDRLGVDALELVQFAWWDLSQPNWVRAAEWLAELRQEGVIRHLGVTNFDRASLAALLDAGIPVVSSQVQLSVLDRRPLKGLTELCRERGVAVLAYGALAGGLLSDAGGVAAETRSLAKYRLVAEEAGGRRALGRARRVLAKLAARHRATMADAAVAYVLAQAGVWAAIVGLSRRGLGVDGRRVRLTPSDVEDLEAAVPDTVGGEVFEVERDREGRHGRIMRYNLSGAR